MFEWNLSVCYELYGQFIETNNSFYYLSVEKILSEHVSSTMQGIRMWWSVKTDGSCCCWTYKLMEKKDVDNDTSESVVTVEIESWEEGRKHFLRAYNKRT